MSRMRDTSKVSQFLASRPSRSLVKVALCGDGGDEVFLGYEVVFGGTTEAVIRTVSGKSAALAARPFAYYLDSIQQTPATTRAAFFGAADCLDARCSRSATRCGRAGAA